VILNLTSPEEARQQAIAASFQKAWNRLKNGFAGLLAFVLTFCKIEQPDTGAVLPFTLWPAQVEALRAFFDNRLVIVLKARQLGFTWLALAYASWRLLTTPGYRVVALSRGEKEAKELVRRMNFILRYMPAWITVQRKTPKGLVPGWEATTEMVAIHHAGGEDSTFQAFASAPDSGRSFTASLVILDEWAFQPWAEEIWTAAYPTINRAGGSGQVIGLSTGQRGSTFEEIWNKARAGINTFVPIFFDWRADPARTDEWMANTRKNMKNWRQEYPECEEDAFAAGEGAAFDEFDRSVHVVHDKSWYPPLGWKLIRAYDSGYSTRACCKWYAVDNDGNAICYREYYPTKVTDGDQAKEIKRLSKDPAGCPEDIAYTVADPACWQKKSQTGESTYEIFARAGVHMKPADNDRIQGWRRLHEWLKPTEIEADDGGGDKKTVTIAKLRFTPACVNTIRCYPALMVDKNKPEDVDTDGEDHCGDTDRYFVQSRVRPNRDPQAEKARRRRWQALTRPVVSRITGY
jgi:hypothetical protein